MNRLYFFLLFYLLNLSLSRAQSGIHYTERALRIDGQLNEEVWQKATPFEDFNQNFPFDTSKALVQTSVKLAFDNNYLYVGAVCRKNSPEYVIQTLQRDFDLVGNDLFAILINPFNDGRNGFLFYVNPLGVQGEALIEDGGNISDVWDNRWKVETVQTESAYWVEMAIPFKTLRFNANTASWKFNFIRQEQTLNEISSWSKVPRNFNATNLAFCQPIYWESLTPTPGKNISIIPSLTSSAQRDYDADTQDGTVIPSLDAKVSVTPSLNLDLTVNPDFSQAEVDQQVTNLTRFSIFFPERRNFFLENNDLFARFGFRQIRPFFSRRIGLYEGNTVPILAGARLSGKLSDKWRIGVMNMQTEGLTQSPLGAQNYSVVAFQRDVFARSNVAGIFVNRQGFEGSEINSSDYNRILGIDYNLASADNKWYGKFFYHHAFTPDNSSKSLANASFLRYDDENWFLMWNHEYVDKEYDADVGFVPRNKMYNPVEDTIETITYWRLEPSVQYLFYPKDSKINNHGPGVYVNHYMNSAYETTDYLIQLNYRFRFENSASIRINLEEQYTYLFFDTDVTFTDNPLISQGDYHYRNVNFNASTDSRKKIFGTVDGSYGSYYTGTKLTYSVSSSLRLPPYATISLDFRRDEIALPEQEQANLNLIGSQFNVSFSKSLFFNTYLQYNTQAENVNINTRLQWRFKPMSDLFLVYTDNYYPQWNVKNRAITLKFIYWLTV